MYKQITKIAILLIFSINAYAISYIPKLYLGGYTGSSALGQADVLAPIYLGKNKNLYIYGQGRYADDAVGHRAPRDPRSHERREVHARERARRRGPRHRLGGARDDARRRRRALLGARAPLRGDRHRRDTAQQSHDTVEPDEFGQVCPPGTSALGLNEVHAEVFGLPAEH